MAEGVDRCLWCGEPIEDPALRLAGRVRCPACGSETTDPMPSEADLAEAYGSWYRPDAGRFSGLGDRLLHRLRGTAARRLDAIAPPGPILDVGAGDGALLDALGRRGRRAVGLERESDREDVLAADISEVEGEYAAVVFWHSLEHLPAPAEAVEHARRLLAPGGVVVIAVPNIDSLQARAFGDRWLALDLPRHLVHLSKRALVSGLERRGLRVERVSDLRGGQIVFGWLHGIVGLLPGSPDLYDAIRRPEARTSPIGSGRRIVCLTSAVVALPAALAASAIEVALGRGGTVYVEARLGSADPHRSRCETILTFHGRVLSRSGGMPR
jgi:SAM-dependent methyltransferase